MKTKTIIMVLICALAITPAKAQQSIDLLIGANTSHLGWSLDDSFDKMPDGWALGGQVGFEYPLSINKFFYLAPGLEFSTKGWRYEEGTDDLSVVIQDIGVPIQVRFELPITDNFGFMLNAGAYYKYSLRAVQTRIEYNFLSIDKTKENIPMGDGPDDILSRYDLGFILGGGFLFGNVLTRFDLQTGMTLAYSNNENLNRYFNMRFTLGYRLDI